VTLFRIVRASGGGRRAGQRHLSPLVGREEELAMLMRRWVRARQGDGQLVLSDVKVEKVGCCVSGTQAQGEDTASRGACNKVEARCD
jgi:hypothetical protein